MKNKIKNILLILLLFISLIIVIGGMILYFLTYKADFSVDKLKKHESSYVDFIEGSNYTFIRPKDQEESSIGIIFYSGGFVEEDAYLPMLIELCKEGYGVYLTKNILNLPILNFNIANQIIDKGIFNKYALIGHSLGGTSLLKYLSKQSDQSQKVSDVILLSSYSDGSFVFDPYKNPEYKNSINMLSILPTKDEVINLHKYEEDKKNLPDNTEYFVMEGGNHGQFGTYGPQRGDGEATILLEEQQSIVLDKIIKFLDK